MGKKKNTTEMEKLQAELLAEREAKLMALADLDNYRKRVEQDRQKLIQLSSLAIFRALIEVIDDFERMITDLEEKGVEDKIDAFKPILDKVKGILADYGVKEEPIKEGSEFNPELMEAIGVVNVTDENQHNKVFNIAQKAYRLNSGGEAGQVVRHARVIVGKK